MFPDFEKILLKGPFYNGYNHVFKISEKKNPIEIITPKIIINNYNSQYNTLSINCDNLGNAKNTEFLKFINDLEKNIIKNKKKILSFNPNYKPKFISVIENWNNSNRIKCQIYDKNIEVYDIDKNKKSLLFLKNKTTARILIWINELVINNQKWFIKLTAMQIRLLDPLPPVGCIINDEEDEIKSNTVLPDSNYDKYSKMLSMGIPIEAVKNKCKFDGLNPSLIENIDKNNNKNKPKLNMKPLLGDLTKIKLKKTVINKKNNKDYKDSRQFGPSLNDIKNQLDRLKKVQSKR